MPHPNGRERVELYDEPVFHWLMSVEHRRCARSNRPLVLVLVDIRRSRGVPPRLSQAIAQRLAVVVKASLRRTDVVGWYRRGNVMGALLDEPRHEAHPSAITVITQRLSRAFDKHFGQPTARHFRVRFQTYSDPLRTEETKITHMNLTRS